MTLKNSWLYIQVLLRCPLSCKTLHYQGQSIPLFQHWYNVGIRFLRMTERCLELAIAELWLKKYSNEDTCEIGAVTPYYWKNRVKNVVDPVDPHKAVTIRGSLFSLDLTNKSVLSLSTIEHIGTGDYSVPVNPNETAIKAFEKIVKESKRCLITFPTGWNKELDAYFAASGFLNINLQRDEKLEVSLYERNEFDNEFRMVPVKRASVIPYGPLTARGVVIIEKQFDEDISARGVPNE
jgi:hypothetical protein